MVEITYVITDELGIHARPAGQLVREVKAFESNIQIGTPSKMVDAKRIMGVMALALKQNDTLTMTFDGADEKEASGATLSFLKANL